MSARSGLQPFAPKSRKSAIPAMHRRFRRTREKRFKTSASPAQLLAASVPALAPDPVRLAVLAIESFGRASMRASFTGTEVRVAVPDAATAAIFEAAIAETARSRSTDRLIRIVID